MPYPVPPPPAADYVIVENSNRSTFTPSDVVAEDANPTTPITGRHVTPPEQLTTPSGEVSGATSLGSVLEVNHQVAPPTIFKSPNDRDSPSRLGRASLNPAFRPPYAIAPVQLDRAYLTQVPALDGLAQSDQEPLPASETPETPTPIEPEPPSGQILVIPEPEPPPVPPTDNPIPTVPSDPAIPLVPIPGVTPLPTPEDGGIIQLTADRQEYDSLRQIFFAEGNAVMRFRGAVLVADRLRVNVPNRTALAQGNVVFTRGQQVVRSDRFNYNFIQQRGSLADASGEIFIPSAGSDLAATLPTDVSAGATSDVFFSDYILAEQPLSTVTTTGGLSVSIGGGGRTPTSNADAGVQGEVRRLRFEAEEVDLDGENFVARNVRLTNDPFSPPELELRSRQVTFTRLSPTRSEIRARNPRIVFDGGFSLPFLRNRFIIDERDRNSGLVDFGFDDEDRDGFFLQRDFELLSLPQARLTITPQILVQRALFENGGDVFDPSSYGLISSLEIDPDQLTSIEMLASISSLNLDELDDNTRASIRVRRGIATPLGRHNLTLQYVYRDRVFNGSLGDQEVQRSLGFVFTSPAIRLGTSGINLSYQAGAQSINANTDRLDLLEPIRDNNRVTLGRFQASAALSYPILLWFRPPLPATREQGLRYSPVPVTPYVQLFTGLRSTTSHYTTGDTQATLTGTIGVQGQFGYFSRPFLDYTAFNVTYSQGFTAGESPFRFDRDVDQQVLGFGVLQQLYGPFRAGFQTFVSIDENTSISTDIILEYSRRTYSVTLRVNPVYGTGSLSLRINDFNWLGNPERFSGADNSAVPGGVER